MKPLTRFILFFTLLTAGTPLPAQDPTYIPARDYLATAEREIDAARSTVRLYLYLLNYDPAQPASQPARLLQALVRAHRRGVKVDVLLNRSTGAERTQGLANEDAAAFLRAQGIPAALTSGPNTLHAKVLVLDDHTVLAGSTNWSASAFARNGEGNFLIRSPAAARAAVGELGAFPREPLPPAASPAIPVPAAFLTGGALGKMVRRKDERSFDLYLYLLHLRAKAGASEFPVDDHDLIAHLGLHAPTHSENRSPMLRDLRHLQAYGLITMRVDRGEDPVVRLEGFSEEGAVLFPAAYFDQRWDRRLPVAAKVFYLISLHETASSGLPPPTWSRSHATLSDRYGMSEGALHAGVAPLRRAGLLDVRYSPLKQTGGARVPNVYASLPFYDPVQREEAFKVLEAKYTPAQLTRARQIAALVYADSDVTSIERLIHLEQLHGRPAVDQALSIIGAKHPTNPRRSMGYLIRTIEGISTEASGVVD